MKFVGTTKLMEIERVEDLTTELMPVEELWQRIKFVGTTKLMEIERVEDLTAELMPVEELWQ